MIKNFKKSISKDEINRLPLIHFAGNIHLIHDAKEAVEAIKLLGQEKILGFDTETRPCFSKGESYQVSLLQLANEKAAYLFRLNKMPFPSELAELLSQKSILKVGVGIQDDIKGLQKFTPFTPGGFLDLAIEAKKIGFTNFGLRSLAAIFLGQRLSKGAKVTNWERVDLTQAQINYAANDAMVGLKIYQQMKSLIHE